MFRGLFQTSPDAQSSVGCDSDQISTDHPGLGRFHSFNEIYRSGPANHTDLPYDIMKVAKMLESPHISSMSAESQRGALMMALEAAGAEVTDILQDSMVRQRALSDYEDTQQKKLRDFESFKGEQN